MLVKLALRMTIMEVRWEDDTKELVVCAAEPAEPSRPSIPSLSS